MATTPEGKVKVKIKKLLDSYGDRVYYFLPSMGGFGRSGVPDIIACVNGKFFGIEVKHDQRKNPPTPLQIKNLNEIQQAGGAALIIDDNNIDQLKYLVDLVLEKNNG